MTKTLDEVIDWYENRKTVLTGLATKQEMEDGVLYYLKQFRNEIRLLDEEHKIYMRTLDEYSKEHKEIETWDELKSMLKKPVWIEQIVGNKIYSGWAIVKEVTDDYLMTNDGLYWHKEFGKSWTIYKKEQRSSNLLQKKIAEKLKSAGIEMEKSK